MIESHQFFTVIAIHLNTDVPLYTYTSLYTSLNSGNIDLVELHLRLLCLFTDFIVPLSNKIDSNSPVNNT